MALISCKDCPKDFSTDSKRCPHCGAKKPKPHGRLKKLFVIIFFICIASYFCGVLLRIQGIDLAERRALQQKIAEEKTEAQESNNKWSYESTEDKMSGHKTMFASLTSENALNFSFPHQGTQKATLTFRYHPKHGKSVIISVDRGQFMCHVSSCSVSVRFGDGEQEKFWASAPDDGSTTAIFINDSNEFIKKTLKSDRVLLQASFYQQGSPILEFDTRGLDKEKISFSEDQQKKRKK